MVYCNGIMTDTMQPETTDTQKGPLEGVRVLEFGNFVAGPWAGQLLADMGADVIKVEPPGGEPWRHAQPFQPAESRVFLPLNRGVRSIELNLKVENGKRALAQVVKTADAAISNNRPDTAETLGIDYDSLAAINPGIIYVDITAYGRKGPRADMPGFDLIMQGFTGAAASEGKVTNNGQPEVVWSSSYIDLSTGYAAALGVLAGIVGRTAGGKGQKVETSLMANAIAMQCLRLIHMYDMPTPAMDWYNGRYRTLLDSGASYVEMQDDYQQVVRPNVYRCYYRAYKTKDGGLCLGTLDLRARARLLTHLGLDDPRVTDPNYVDDGADAERFAREMIDTFERIFETKTTQEWFDELRAADIPCDPIRFSEEVVFDEQADANGYLRDYEHHTGHTYRTSGPILNFTAGMPQPKAAPALGADTEDVLREAGLSDAEIAQLTG